MIINELELKSLSSAVSEELVALYLYGSSVKGRLREESDVDIAILPSHKIDDEERLVLIAKSRRRYRQASQGGRDAERNKYS